MHKGPKQDQSVFYEYSIPYRLPGIRYIKERCLTVFYVLALLLMLVAILVAILLLYSEISLFESGLLNADIFKPSTFAIENTDLSMSLVEQPYEVNTSNKVCIFDPFIKLFDLSSPCVNSCFVDNSFISTISSSEGTELTMTNNYSLDEYLVYHDFYKGFILDEYMKAMSEFSMVINSILDKQ